MLNRRTLRIKIMQSLFAFDQCKEANHQLSQDLIEERFSPDLNSMEVQDKEMLKKQKKVALTLFEKLSKGNELPEDTEKAIAKTVQEAAELFEKQVKKDQNFLQKNIILEIEKLTQLYYSILVLFKAFAEVAEADKRKSHSNFINHPWVKAIEANQELNKEVLKSEAGWKSRIDLVRGWFRDMIKEDAHYQKFLEEKKPDEAAQKEIIKHISRKLILGPGSINDYFEEMDIRWAEDRDIIKSLVDKTIKSFANDKLELQKMSLDWEDDKVFIEKLFKNTIALDPKHKDLIAKNTKNWEVDRLPLTDRIILEMAITEMISFPNIPVKVTINEYIELTKEYSTPKSRQFINGILDVIAKNMKESGAIKKSGRGLIDNK
jgi:transcription antitermination factor NusB